MLVGFIHGVMNTDNMALSGETIDYGPCAFMDTYDPKTVFSSIDRQGRYAYGNQPLVAQWNLARLAQCLLPLLHSNTDDSVRIAEQAISAFPALYQSHWLAGMRAKLGIMSEKPEDLEIIQSLLRWMHEHRADYTSTFVHLSQPKLIPNPLYEDQDFKTWYEQWAARVDQERGTLQDSRTLMQSVNPVIVPRNDFVEKALSAATQQGDYALFQRFLFLLRHPFERLSEHEDLYSLPSPSSTPYRTFCGT